MATYRVFGEFSFTVEADSKEQAEAIVNESRFYVDENDFQWDIDPDAIDEVTK